MNDGEVIYAAERFIARGARSNGRIREIGGTIIYLNAPRDNHKLVEASVTQAASAIVVLLEAGGYRNEAELILERAYQFASEKIPTDEIRDMLNQYLHDIDPGLYAKYQASNR